MISPAYYEPLLSNSARSKVIEASTLVLGAVNRQRKLTVKQLILPLLMQVIYSKCLRSDVLGSWIDNGRKHSLYRFHFQRTSLQKQRIKIGIFAGIHGDEPAGVLGLMDFVRALDEDPELGRSFEISIYPLCNPTGYLNATRESSSGKDLNREFWKNSSEPEVALLEQEILAKRFDGIISLHSDDTAPGFYGYARGSVLSTGLLAPALRAAEKEQQRDSREVIDGFRAVNGIIHDCYDGILSAPPDQVPKPFEIILESPVHTSLTAQRNAFTLALKAILSEYRKFIAFGAEI